jgi:hypothetical protein
MNSEARSRRARRAGIAAMLAIALISITVVSAAGSEKKKHITPYALIFGTVWDVHNRTAPGVKIRIQRETDKKPKWELYSDVRGEFAQRVPAQKADYLVWAELKGHKGHVSETKVHIEGDERQDIGLHLPE